MPARTPERSGWGAPGNPGLDLLASAGALDDAPPAQLADVADGRRYVEERPGLRLVVLGEEPPATLLILRVGPSGELDADGLRVAQLARHELAVAFGEALLREALERERHELSAVVEGATDVILQVDEDQASRQAEPGRRAGARHQHRGGRTDGPAPTSSAAPRRAAMAKTIARSPRLSRRACRSAIARPRSGRPAGVPSASRAATRERRRRPAARSGRRRSSATSAPSGRSRSSVKGFVATVSHELRTPLALVRGYAETLLHFDLEPAQQREYIDRIHSLTSRLGSLVDQILDITHLDADPLILERAPIAFSALVARLRGDLALSGDDARLTSELPEGLPDVDVDAGRIGRVLENLVGNALKYSPPGSTVSVGAAADGDWLAATVDDEGVGIPDTERDLVLEPFHRAWNVRESRIPGTGLGLSICRRLVEAHGGRLSVGDRPDGRPGTRVMFTVPLAAAREPAPPGPAGAARG